MQEEWRLRGTGEIPSYRRTRLAEMAEREHPLRVHLREASTFTSTLYRPNPRDSFFVFFTRDRWLPRPLYGAVNLVAGLGQAAVGLVRLPFDGGEALTAAWVQTFPAVGVDLVSVGLPTSGGNGGGGQSDRAG